MAKIKLHSAMDDAVSKLLNSQNYSESSLVNDLLNLFEGDYVYCCTVVYNNHTTIFTSNNANRKY